MSRGPLLLAAVLDHAVDQHAFAEAELLDHRAGHERIGSLAGEVGRGVAEEAVAVGVHFQHAQARLDDARFAVVGHRLVFGIGRPIVRILEAALAVASARPAVGVRSAASATTTAAAATAHAASTARPALLSFTHVSPERGSRHARVQRTDVRVRRVRSETDRVAVQLRCRMPLARSQFSSGDENREKRTAGR